MDIDFLNMTQSDFLVSCLYPRAINQEKCFVVTANPEIVMKTREDKAYQTIVQSADFVVPDGIGILMAAKYMKQPLKERIAGFDLMMDLLSFANREGLSCYFLGAEERVNEKAVTKVKERFPHVKVAGHHHGFFDIADKDLADKIARTNPDFIFVAVGFPRQEQWIKAHMDNFSKGIFVGVGGSFDVLAGEVKRAPNIWIRLNLEWLYRLLKQPTRFKRVLKLFEFMIKIPFQKKS